MMDKAGIPAVPHSLGVVHELPPYSQEIMPAAFTIHGLEPVPLSQTGSLTIHETRQSIGSEVTNPEILAPAAVLGAAALVSAATFVFNRARIAVLEHRRQKDRASREGEQEILRKVSHQGTKLVLRNLLANVAIEDGGNEVTLELSGFRSRVHQVAVTGSDDKSSLVVEGVHDRDHRVRSWPQQRMLMRSLTNWITARRSNISYAEPEEQIGVFVRVPTGHNISIENVTGSVTADGEYGNVEVVSAFEQPVLIGHAKSAKVTGGESNIVTFSEVNGTVDFTGKEGSGLTINSGRIEKFTAITPDYNIITVNGHVGDVSIRSGSSNKIKLASAYYFVDVSTGDFCVVNIDDGDTAELSLNLGSDSEAHYNGSALNSNVIAGNRSHIRLANIAGGLKAFLGYGTDLKIGRDSNIVEAEVDLPSHGTLDVYGPIESGVLDIGNNSLVTVQSIGKHVKVISTSTGHIMFR